MRSRSDQNEAFTEPACTLPIAKIQIVHDTLTAAAGARP
jgi:hypothetical protein